MAKKKFYALSRYRSKSDGSLKVGYMPREGFDVPNDFGLDLAIYRAKDNSADTNWKGAKVWFVVDTRSGLSISQDDTRKKAVEAALTRLESMDMDKYRNAAAKAAEAYGPCPGQRG